MSLAPHSISEINTRRGLNAVHKNFDKVTQKLDEAYNHFLSDDRITAGIVGIYTQMCADAKLKDKLIKERGAFFSHENIFMQSLSC